MHLYTPLHKQTPDAHIWVTAPWGHLKNSLRMPLLNQHTSAGFLFISLIKLLFANLHRLVHLGSLLIFTNAVILHDAIFDRYPLGDLTILNPKASST